METTRLSHLPPELLLELALHSDWKDLQRQASLFGIEHPLWKKLYHTQLSSEPPRPSLPAYTNASGLVVQSAIPVMYLYHDHYFWGHSRVASSPRDALTALAECGYDLAIKKLDLSSYTQSQIWTAVTYAATISGSLAVIKLLVPLLSKKDRVTLLYYALSWGQADIVAEIAAPLSHQEIYTRAHLKAVVNSGNTQLVRDFMGHCSEAWAEPKLQDRAQLDSGLTQEFYHELLLHAACNSSFHLTTHQVIELVDCMVDLCPTEFKLDFSRVFRLALNGRIGVAKYLFYHRGAQIDTQTFRCVRYKNNHLELHRWLLSQAKPEMYLPADVAYQWLIPGPIGELYINLIPIDLDPRTKSRLCRTALINAVLRKPNHEFVTHLLRHPLLKPSMDVIYYVLDKAARDEDEKRSDEEYCMKQDAALECLQVFIGESC